MAGKNASCLTCDSVKVVSRGLCDRCYRAARAAINSGEMTERQLIRKGWLLPHAKTGRKAGGLRAKLGK